MITTSNNQLAVVWQPLHGSQMLAMSCPCNHILYEGTRGPGKTDAQLMYFRKHVGIGYGSWWRGIIVDKTYKALDDLISKSKRWFTKFNDGARFLESMSSYKWVWPSGEELLFRHMRTVSDYWRYHGQEFPFIGWNELTKFPTSELYDLMMSCNRSSFVPQVHSPQGSMLPEIPLVVFSTTNPYGVGHNWVKRRFIDMARPGEVVRTETDIYNPRTQKKELITKTQVRIFGSYRENKYLSPEYIAELEQISDPNRRKAWLYGDWEVVAGGAFDDLWGRHLIVPRFKVPSSWRVDRSFDWGSSHPFSIGWWAEANGEQVALPDGTTFAAVRGSLIRIFEWYGAASIGTNVGRKLSAAEICEGIKTREKKLLQDGYITTQVQGGPADNQIMNSNERDVESISRKMAQLGVYWTQSDKRAGSRTNGFQLTRERMVAAKRGEGPALYFMSNCEAAIAILPTLPRDEKNLDDVDTNAEDHIYDEIRYRILAGSEKRLADLEIIQAY